MASNTGLHVDSEEPGGGGGAGSPAAGEDILSPFASHAAAQAGSDPEDAATLAAEADDDVAELKDAAASAAALRGAAGGSAKAAGAPVAAPAAAAAAAAADYGPGHSIGGAGSSSSNKQRSKRKLIPLKKVVRQSYEYHGINDLFFFCITAMAVTMVLYFHWSRTTATFKATVQRSFQSYGNPDWQGNSLTNVDTMYDAVEYTMGWMEFWLQRADNIGWANETVRVGEYGDIKLLRMLVNIDRNCDPPMSPDLECYKNDPTTQYLRNEYPSLHKEQYFNLLNWSGWTPVGELKGRDSANAGSKQANQWWAYTIIAPLYRGKSSTRDNFIGRMYNITRNSNLNYNNCDWANSTCAEVGPYTDDGPSGPQCARSGVQVPFSSWWASTAMCASNNTKDQMSNATTHVKRGGRYFVRHPFATLPESDERRQGLGNVVDLKPFLSKYAYTISLDVLASNAVNDDWRKQDSERDQALFTMTLQRSATAKGRLDRIMWQITSTVPVRTSFYSQGTDILRSGFEALLYICLIVVLSLQAWQIYVVRVQHNSFKPWLAHTWNCFEALSNIALLAWVVYYVVLVAMLQGQSWELQDWDIVERLAHDKLNSITLWSTAYSAYLYMGVVVNALFGLRLARYMRVHVGLKAFYQVFIIAAREFLDFAVFVFYTLIVLGSALFSFFQLTGGNSQFLRFPDGLSLMSRLTFGFSSFDEFQSQALGVGAAVSAVTFLFWVAVLLLVVFTQNIILAIIAEAYEEAKAKLGTAETSFLMLVLMRLVFLVLFLVYRLKMFCRDVFCACCCGRRKSGADKRQLSGMSRSGSACASGAAGMGSGAAPGDAAAAAGLGTTGASTQPQDGPWDPWQAGGGSTESLGLAPTMSRAVLPLEVVVGLSGDTATTSRAPSSRVNLLPSAVRTSSQYAGALLPMHAQSSADRELLPLAGTASTAGATCGSSVKGFNVASRSASTAAEGSGQQSLRQRLSDMWRDVILGERHVLRMYRDLGVVGQSDDSWVRRWKERYYRPWCIARTAPLHCLTNLYLDFASYKLKEECAWTANAAAKEVIAATWTSNSAQQSSPGATGSNGSTGQYPAPTLEGSNKGSDLSSLALLAFPALLNETYVDEDTLARLFLVTSNMSSVLRVWNPPFHRLTSKEVSYLVKGISDVYGVDEELVLQQQGRVISQADSLGMQASIGPGSGSGPDMRDAQLGTRLGRKGSGGFFSHLNNVRRDGAEQKNRQINWLLHANKRLEEAALRNAGQLDVVNTRISMQLNQQEEFQRRQQRTNSELLKGLQDLLHAQQQLGADGAGASPFAGAAAFNVDRASSGGTLSPVAGAGGAASAARRINSMAASATSKVFGFSRSNTAAGRGPFSRQGSDLASPTSPTAAVAPDDHVLASLQEQLEQQQRALEQQQKLLEQVLSRLPAPQE